jgi:hypothetical protein
LERGKLRARRLLEYFGQREMPIVVPAVVLVEWWNGSRTQAGILQSVDVVPTTEEVSSHMVATATGASPRLDLSARYVRSVTPRFREEPKGLRVDPDRRGGAAQRLRTDGHRLDGGTGARKYESGRLNGDSHARPGDGSALGDDGQQLPGDAARLPTDTCRGASVIRQ